MNGLLLDFRAALRGLRTRPGFSLSLILLLALGVGATTAVFGVVRAVLLRPLDFPQPGRLVVVCERNPSVAGYCIGSPPDAADLAARSRTLASVGLARWWHFALKEGGETVGVNGGLATPGFFRALGVRPRLGRLLEPGDVGEAAARVVFLSDDFWRARFGADPGVLGRVLRLDGMAYRVAGVLPVLDLPEFSETKLWTAVPWDPRDESRRDWRGFTVLGRMAPGATLASVRAELRALGEQLATEHPSTNRGWRLEALPARDWAVGSVRPMLLLFGGAVLLVLLIVCANAANLLLVRASARRTELAVRVASGASRARLVRQLLTETGVLTTLAACVGFALAWAAVRALLAVAPAGIPRLARTSVDPLLLAFALALALGTTLLFGLAPAAWASRTDLAALLRGGARGGQAGGRGRSLLAVSELSLSLVLLVAAGLLLRSFARLATWDPGFDRGHVLTVQVFAPTERYPQPADVAGLYDRAEAALGALPGVVSVGAASAGPVFGGVETGEYTLPARGDAGQAAGTARWYDVSDGYFRALGVPLVRGRWLTAADGPGAPPVALVNQTLARQAWPDQDPVGRRIRMKDEDRTVEVVGVVQDVPPFHAGTAPDPEIYWPQRQAPRWGNYFILRTAVPPASLAGAVRRALAGVEPDLEVSHVRTMNDMVALRAAGPRFDLLLAGAFAGLALLLALAGLYAVLAFAVSQRRREFGIRLALGGRPRDVALMVLGEAGRLIGAGVVLGAAGALAAARLLVGLLYGVDPGDPATLAAGAALLAIVALAAALLPALRAGREDPRRALRES